jgi:hypothetical protein
MRYRLLSGWMTFPAALLLLALSAESTVYKHTEDFTTSQYKDTLATTALWDTAAGELKLPPFRLELLGGYDGPDRGEVVVIEGDYAYVAGWEQGGLRIVDVSDPASPFLAGFYNTPVRARSVCVSGNYAFVADDSNGLQIYNITDPTTPTLAGIFSASVSYDVAVYGNYAYVAIGPSGLRVADISNPASPFLAGTNASCQPYCVMVHGDYLLTSNGPSNSLSFLDISDPASPSVVGSCATAAEVFRIDIAGDYAYVGSKAGLLVVDIEDPADPSIAATYDAGHWVRDVFVSGDFAYITVDSVGVGVVDISDPLNPVDAGGCILTETTHYSIAVAGLHAFVASADTSLRTVRIAEIVVPPERVGSIAVTQTEEMAIAGDYAYAAAGPYGLRVVDISDPLSPVEVGSVGTLSSAYGVAVSGDNLYVAVWSGGFQVIDISAPAAPATLGSCSTRCNMALDVDVAGDFAFIADTDSGMTVVDISDPAHPTVVGGCVTTAAFGIAVDGDYAFVADYTSGLRVIDISDPTNPSIIGGYNTPDQAFDVVVEGDFAYVADRNTGMVVIDISNPAAPTYAGGYNTPSGAYGLCVEGDLAFVADNYAGLTFLDISNPASPALIGSCDTPYQARNVSVFGDYVFVSDWPVGIQAVQIMQRAISPSDSIGQSLDVNPFDGEVFEASLVTTQTDTVTWEISADGGSNWQAVTPGGGWNRMAFSGDDFRWRSAHVQAGISSNPTCTSLQIDFIYDFPQLMAVEDVPNDQGRQVSISWLRSGYDFAGSPAPIVEYAVYRRIDHLLAAEAGIAGEGSSKDESDAPRRTAASSLLYPPGDWHFLTTVPARIEEEYAVVVPTLEDSTIAEGMYRTTFFVSAMTSSPAVYFDSPPDSGYSVDNLAPGVPLGLAVAYNTGSGNDLSWEPAAEEDFRYYRVYRDDSEAFTPGPGNLVHQTAAPAWTDPDYDGSDVYYKVTSLDFAGNESEPASAATTTGEDLPGVPTEFDLYQNSPNPFNPSTTIRFDLPVAGPVRLDIYNVKGERISTLVDRHMTEGRKEVTWEGRDMEGGALASGVYFYRLVAGDFVQTRKMVLLR